MVWPVVIGYLDAARMLIGWCELRKDFRSFRVDRIIARGLPGGAFPRAPGGSAREMARDLAEAAGSPL